MCRLYETGRWYGNTSFLEVVMISKVHLKRISGTFLVAAAVVLALPAPFAAAQSLDYEFFKTRVEPIFLKRRSADHARCYACHEKTKHFSGMRLESLSPGATFWTEEQSRRNFQTVSALAVPGKPLAGLFPRHPLAPEAGGDSDRIHAGGRQFESQDDPDWQTLAAWVRGQKAGGSSAP